MKTMKRVFSLLLSLLMVLTLVPFNMAEVFASGGEGVAIDETNFPDEVFRQFVADSFDGDNDGYLSEEEIAGVTEINLENQEIYTLIGIEHFACLRGLNCSGNQLVTLDVSGNPELEYLNCQYNKLTILDMGNSPSITGLYCGSNPLTELIVTGCPSLSALECTFCKLATLDLSSNQELDNLQCRDNQLVTLDLSNKPLLKWVTCPNNQLSSLNITNCPELFDIWCSGNQLSKLDVSSNPSLSSLRCYDNRISSLNVSNNPKLFYFECHNNLLTSLDVSDNPQLSIMSCYGNMIRKLDLTNNSWLSYLSNTPKREKDGHYMYHRGTEMTDQILEVDYDTVLIARDTPVKTPVITSVVNTISGPKITWSKSDGATVSYSVYTKSTDGSFTSVGYIDRDETLAYVHRNAVNGETYTYVVKANSGGGFASDYSEEKTITYLAAPKITSAVNTVSGTKITWSKSAGATGYTIYTKASDGKLTQIATVSGEATLTYTHKNATSGKSYTYVVRANGATPSSYYSEGKTITYLAAPKVSNAVNTVSGPRITWNKIDGATGYIILRKEGASAFKEIKTVSGNGTVTYTDTTAASGKKYTYAVKANGANPSSYYSAGKTITYLAAPRVSAVVNTVNGPKVTWNKIAGATGYIILRKEGSGAYKEIKTVSGNGTVTYTDTTAASGKKYTYAVKSNGTNPSSYYSAGKTITYLAAPRVSAVVNTVNGTKVTWNKITGATGYIILRKEGSGAFKAIKTVSGNGTLTYTDTTAASGKKYTYAVKANGTNPSSYYSAGRTISYLTAPRVSAVSNTKSGPKVTWNKITGATGYIVMRKEGSGAFKAIKTVSGNGTLTYTDTTAVKGKTYTYAVKANGTNPSSYYSAGKTIKCSK